MIVIPSQQSKQWMQPNAGDQFGPILRTRGIDLYNNGHLALARKPAKLFGSDDAANFELPLVLTADNNTAYAVTTKKVYTFDPYDASLAFLEETGGTVPTLSFQTDACSFAGVLHVSGTTTVSSLSGAGGTFTSRITGLSASYPHPLCVSEHQAYLAVGNGNTVNLYSSAYSLIVTLTIPSQFVVEWITWRANVLYVGTRNIKGGNARVFLWNGSGTASQAAYEASGTWLYAGIEHDSSIVVVTSRGQLARFNGGGFSPVANFPVYNSRMPWISSASVSNLVGKVAPRGMKSSGDRIYINIDGSIASNGGGFMDHLTEMPSGLWVYDKSTGLTHRAGIDSKTVQTVQMTAIGSGDITIDTAAVFETGDPVLCVSVSGVSGISIGNVYYAIKVSATILRLAYSAADAMNNRFIRVSGTPGVSDKLMFHTYRSTGATHVTRTGGIHMLDGTLYNSFFAEEVLFAATVNDNTGSSVHALCSLGMGKNVGSFTTSKINASGVTDLFKKIFAKFPVMNVPSRKLIIKYRTDKKFGLPGRGGADCTWVDSTSFTVDPTAYDIGSVSVGDEIEFIEGAASGYTAHISSILKSSAAYTITVDEALPDVAASDTSTFDVDNWTKYKTVSTVDDAKAAIQGFKEGLLTKAVTNIQIKIELRGYADFMDQATLEELALINTPDQKYK